jgi:radical SAM superfamily enzyme YgiQ (UPF0313 family)
MRAVLISTYDLGHQPFGLSSAAAWLEEAGVEVRLFDLAVEHLNDSAIAGATLVAFYVPMHTATRLAVPLIRRLRSVNKDAHFCAFGLYAPLNAGLLQKVGIDTVIGGEFEAPLVNEATKLDGSKTSSSQALTINLDKQRFRRPVRGGLPALRSYAYLNMPDGSRKHVGYTEASRGCKHLCRHCPIVPVYEGRFFVVQRDVVLADVRQQVAAGATHITFGDPDFFNGVGHSLAIIETLHSEFPSLTYDVTIKIEHILKHQAALARLRETGCLFVTSAVESVDDHVLSRLCKGHTRADFVNALEACRTAELTFSPTFVAFTPWLTPEGYCDLLQVIDDMDLVQSVAPVQLNIRLLIPAGSGLLDLAEIKEVLRPYDHEALFYPWVHPDVRVDTLHEEIAGIVHRAVANGVSRVELFSQIQDRAKRVAGRTHARPVLRRAVDTQKRVYMPIPQMSEPWYCCAEPTARQRDAY